MAFASEKKSFTVDKLIAANGVSITCSRLFADITGDFTGNITGNVTGDVTGDVTGGTIAADSLILPNTVGDEQQIIVHNRYIIPLVVITNNPNPGSETVDIDVKVDEFGDMVMLTFPTFAGDVNGEGGGFSIDCSTLGTAKPSQDTTVTTNCDKTIIPRFTYDLGSDEITITDSAAPPGSLPVGETVTFTGFTWMFSK